MDKEELKEKLLDFWDSVKETSAKVWEEIVDRALDVWDSFKRLPQNAQYAIMGAVAVVVLVAVLAPLLHTTTLPLIAVQNTSGVTGEGNWIAVKNTSGKTFTRLNIIMDDKYIYYIDKIGPGEQVKILNKDFYIRLPGNKFGEQVGQELTGSKLLVISKKGQEEIPLVEKHGFFGN